MEKFTGEGETEAPPTPPEPPKEEVVADKTPGDYKTGDNGESLAGSPTDPYKISSIEDLIAFAINGTKKHSEFEGKYVVLTTDLDFNSSNSYVDSENTYEDIEGFRDYNGDGNVESIMKEVTKIGKTGYKPIDRFVGNFDGQGHTIKNVYINYENNNSDYIGFFGYLREGSSVKNLNIVDGTLNYKYDENGEYILKEVRIGGLAGRIHEATSNLPCAVVEDCIIDIDLNINIPELKITTESGNYSSMYVGGIVANNEGTLNRCQNKGDINTTIKRNNEVENAETYNWVGGIAGKSETKIQNCINYGKVQYNGTKAPTSSQKRRRSET